MKNAAKRDTPTDARRSVTCKYSNALHLVFAFKVRLIWRLFLSNDCVSTYEAFNFAHHIFFHENVETTGVACFSSFVP